MHFPDKLGMAAGAPPGLQVCQVIADKPGFGNIDVHIPGGFSPVNQTHLNRFPLHFRYTHQRVGNDKVPDDALKGLGMRGDGAGIYHRNDDAAIRDLSSITAVPATIPSIPAPVSRAYSSALTRLTLTFFFRLPPPTDRTKPPVFSGEITAFQPGRETGFPAVIIDAGGEFGNIIGGGIGFDAGDFPEIVHRVGSITRAFRQRRGRTAALFSRGYRSGC